ncbi:MAG: ATP-binding cassette domain-containing protein [Actinophytocola sp.]|uniref:ATP-binding cassette domain-containing protein n=1 Tax=Actinophytocola sp. TaxID=1872138 RepID=UPI003D6B7321
MPDPDRAVATTPHREYLIRRAQDSFERERTELEARRAEVMKSLARATERADAARNALARATERLAEIPSTLTEPELSRRRYLEDTRSPVMVRLRRSREHSRRRAGVDRLVQAAQHDLDVATERLAVEQDAANREIVVARTRVRRIHEFTHRRLTAYRRRLVRSHAAGAWVNEVMDSVAPEVPGWAVRGVTGDPLPDGPRPRPAPPAPEPVPPKPRGSRLITIGEETRFGSQGGSVDVLIEDGYGVAGVHATLTRRGGGHRLVDHGRGDGTFQEGRPLRWTDLKLGDTFAIGDCRYRLVAEDIIEETWLDRPDLVVADLHATDDRGRSRLTGMSFTQWARSVLAILGPSGAGKSSLFAALLGELDLAKGSMYFSRMNLRTHRAQIRTMLGFVPQNDDMHRTLTVRQLLRFSDRLRRPPDRARGRDDRVVEVCAKLGLEERLDRRVEQLSGGQRKRVSIALEILAGPRLLMLDEPTSGLDPAMDFEVMELLATLAAEGRTVVVVTHSTQHLAAVDQVLVVAGEGRPVHLGPPGSVIDDLRAGSYAELMKQLTADPEPAAKRYQAGMLAGTARTLAEKLRRVDTAQGPTRPRGSGAAFLRQFPVLLHRQFALILARAPLRNVPELHRRLKAVAVIGMPFVISVAGALLAGPVVGEEGWGTEGGPGSAAAATAVSLLITLSMLGGQALTYSDIVTEYDTIHREHRTGASTAAVVLAKWLVFAAVATLQALLVTATFVLVLAGPERSVALGPTTELFVNLAAMSVAAMSAGLLISVLAKRLEQAVALATAAAIAQVALSGGMSDLASKPWFVQAVSWLLPARWGFAATASSVDLQTLAPGPTSDPLWEHSTTQWAFDLSMLGMLTVAFTAAAIVLLNRRLTGRQQ